MITAKGLNVRHGQKAILHGVDFQARSGEITVVAGPNGSGKSTLVRAISGELAFEGSVTINGVDASAMKAWEMAAVRAVLPQETLVTFPFTAGEVVRLGLTTGIFSNRAVRNQMVEAALERVGLAGFSRRIVHELSGGERQRVQLARVLCQIWEPVGEEGPRWLIMDEPVSSLDVRHQLAVMELARDYAAGGGGVIAVMHDLNLSALYADHIAFMKDGRFVAEGTPAEVVTAEVLEAVFDCALKPGLPPRDGIFVLPQSAASQPTNLSLAAE
ncbi:heme ABC transporter ATP-binding protein [Rhizobium sp. L1K21]|uniref:heme ABC transporter ATP-binding protein n=1 Tax=Rhizobium sp. L1K21 TaxID=2954933 RepID=UPI0020929A98|nr:heme ABC transporter ATP-binding protein [Rhizobium sp. L1K21]MCO6185251.1 heme ABC transporter ATP-binding protein [Rhizobium sp. L1K21]